MGDHANQDVLCRIPGVVRVPEHPEGQVVDWPPNLFHNLCEALAVPVTRSLHQDSDCSPTPHVSRSVANLSGNHREAHRQTDALTVRQ